MVAISKLKKTIHQNNNTAPSSLLYFTADKIELKLYLGLYNFPACI